MIWGKHMENFDDIDHVQVQLDWLPEPILAMERTQEGGSTVLVTAHAGLSHGQVKAACDSMGSHGAKVLGSWERHVGIQAGFTGLQAS
jgi:hypothetical protein